MAETNSIGGGRGAGLLVTMNLKNTKQDLCPGTRWKCMASLTQEGMLAIAEDTDEQGSTDGLSVSPFTGIMAFVKMAAATFRTLVKLYTQIGERRPSSGEN